MKSSKKIFAGLVLSMMLLFTGCQTAAVQEEVKTSAAAVQEETTSAEETFAAESSSEAASSDEYILSLIHILTGSICTKGGRISAGGQHGKSKTMPLRCFCLT